MSEQARRGEGECKLPLCDRVVFCRGWCSLHYNRWRRTRTVLPSEKKKRRAGPGTVCLIQGCGVEVKSRGLCGMHYTRWKNHRDPHVVKPKGKVPTFRPCSVEGCQGQHQARGLCGKHYQRWKKWGDPLYTLYTHDPERASDIARRANEVRNAA